MIASDEPVAWQTSEYIICPKMSVSKAMATCHQENKEGYRAESPADTNELLATFTAERSSGCLCGWRGACSMTASVTLQLRGCSSI